MSKTCLHIHTVFAEDLKMDQEYLVPVLVTGAGGRVGAVGRVAILIRMTLLVGPPLSDSPSSGADVGLVKIEQAIVGDRDATAVAACSV